MVKMGRKLTKKYTKTKRIKYINSKYNQHNLLCWLACVCIDSAVGFQQSVLLPIKYV
jgi:hypothetical protein